MITDTGYISDRMKGMIHGSDVFMFESNHDVDMLRMSISMEDKATYPQ